MATISKRLLSKLISNCDFHEQLTDDEINELINLNIIDDYSNMFKSAYHNNRIEIIKILLTKDIDLEVINMCLRNSRGKIDIIKLICSTIEFDQSVLNDLFVSACSSNISDIAKLLYFKGAQLESSNYLVFAFSYHDIGFVNWLYEKYAEENQTEFNIYNCFTPEFYEKNKSQCDQFISSFNLNNNKRINANKYNSALKRITQYRRTFDDFSIYFIKELKKDYMFEPKIINIIKSFVFINKN